MKGQLSAEMLILIVVIMAVVGIAGVQLMSSAKETSNNIKNETNRINSMTADALKSQAGEACMKNDDCMSNSCSEYTCR